jgi:hypothetical protein
MPAGNQPALTLTTSLLSSSGADYGSFSNASMGITTNVKKKNTNNNNNNYKE